jgi:hypothetical protein
MGQHPWIRKQKRRSSLSSERCSFTDTKENMSMKKTNILIAGLCIGLAPAASTLASAAPIQTATKYVTIEGNVIRYEPGRVIVVKGNDNREIVYTIGPTADIPADVRVGQRVTLYTETSPTGGTQLVTRVTTTTVTPEGAVRRTTEDVRTSPSGEQTRTIVGDVIRYEPGRVIVVRGNDNREMSYTLAPRAVVPNGVAVGRKVTLYTEPNPDGGTQLVTRVTTTTVTPEGNIQKTTEDTRTLPSGATSTTTTTTVTGQVLVYEPGKTLTVTKADGTKATYVITGTSTVPEDLAVGKTITIVPVTTTNANGEVVVRTITYVKPRQ